MSKTPFFPRPTQSLPPGAFEDSVANSPTPGPSSKGKGKERQGRSKDTRDFSNPDVLRGTFQAMEQTQKSQYENSQTAINHLRDEIRNLTQLMAANLKPELPTPIPGPSAETNRVVPTIERASTQPISDRDTSVHADSNTRKIKIQLTEKIFPLDDGNDPSFKQWKASVTDRLEVNSDLYPTERARRALIWGSTTGLARSYLEPQYLSATNPFRSSTEMIDLLASYFLTGQETDAFRSAFHLLQMGEPGHANETFPQFRARFQSAALQGEVTRSEWFFYMWNKITPQLRGASASIKFMWKGSFSLMVQQLNALDAERRRNQILNPSQNTSKVSSIPSRNTAATTSKPSSTSAYRSASAKTSEQAPLSRVSSQPPKPSTPFRRNPTPKSNDEPEQPTCWGCGKTGHYKNECTSGGKVNVFDDLEEESDSLENVEDTEEPENEEA